MKSKLPLLGLLICMSVLAQDYISYSAPELLDYDELVQLSKDEEFPPELAQKLENITHQAFVSNEAWYKGARPLELDLPGLGKSMRVVIWNIERGVTLDKVKMLFTDADAFLDEALANPNNEEKDNFDLDKLREHVQILQEADILIINEVDLGMPRSKYREVAKEFGEAINMNWAFAVEFVEIDPVVLGLEGFDDVEDEETREELEKKFQEVDKERIRALHGTAIFSRYPIRQATAHPFSFQPYDWYHAEKGIRPTEKGIRGAANILGDDLNREMRRGGRTTLTVHLDVPSLEGGVLTVVSPHLENRTKPKNRQIQMAEVLDFIKDISSPVIVAGDLNTTGGDSESFAIEKKLAKKAKEPDTWVNMGVKAATGVGFMYDVLKFGFKYTKNVSDPTVQSVPFFAPNKEQKFFDRIEDYRFADGTAFDFRGDEERTAAGNGGTLGNSNMRMSKGFAATYGWVITIGVIGRYKLDWFFVKSGYLENPRDKEGSYRFAPHFSRVMHDVNSALEEELSDHSPMAIDLPFNDPEI
jgi:endonuclease/exonuclease/phosphatase family metal-dependent hydrolase